MIDTKCLNCGENILADDARICPYCFNKNLEAEEVGIMKNLKCPFCGLRMKCTEVKLRIVGSQGLTEILSIASMYNASGEMILPLLRNVCSKCGKVEFVAKGKKVQKTLNKIEVCSLGLFVRAIYKD